LFAFIATLGAVLAFLGFKGFESFIQARDNAFETVENSKAAVHDAHSAQAQAEAAVEKMQTFLKHDYPRDIGAEINIAHGLVLREVGAVYQCLATHLNKPVSEFPEF